MISDIKTQTWKIMFGSVGRYKENNIKLIKYTEKLFKGKNRIIKYWKQEIHLDR